MSAALVPSRLAPLAVPASWLYGLAIASRNRRFDRGMNVVALRLPVVSVGNLTVGGTGKTPMVAWVADTLRAAGRTPLVAMRGYKARPGGRSDEQAEYAARLPGVPVVASPDRVAAIRVFLEGHADAGVDCVILDDGFQHRRIARTLDLVLIDASVETLDARLLPAGPLREPPASLRRADAVVVTHADHVDPVLAGRIEACHGKPPVAWTSHAWPDLAVHEKGGEPPRRETPQWLAGRRVVTMTGVGKPVAVIRQLETLGAEVATNVPARDHQRYTQAILDTARRVCRGADALVTTGKDWVKLAPLLAQQREPWPVPIAVPRLALDVHQGEEALRALVIEAAGNSG